MSSTLTLRARKRTSVVLSICISVIALVSFWATSQQAANSVNPDNRDITPQASTIIVNSLSDAANGSDGLCTLREAITAANSNTASGAGAGECAAGSSSGSDTVNVTNVTGTINLTSALPDIASDMTIVGPSSSLLTVRRSTAAFYRIFFIASGTVGMSGLTARDGQPLAVGDITRNGGGIYNLGNLTMTDVVVTANRAGGAGSGQNGGSGGGIANQGGTLTMTNCSVTGNFGERSQLGFGGEGGGVFNTGTLTMTNCLISGNKAGDSADSTGGKGGGISNNGQMSLVGTTIINNTGGNSPVTLGGPGGGIYNSGSTQASVVNCTIGGNRAGGGGGLGSGGGIHNDTSIVVVGSTISGNTGRLGGGIVTGGGSTLRLVSSTITGNLGVPPNPPLPNDTGDGVFVGSSTTVLVRNTIIAGNGSAGRDLLGLFTSQGHNLIGGDRGNGFTNGVNGDQVGTLGSPLDPRLGPLADNGGPTLTHALLSNSTALDAGDDCVAQAAHCGDVNIPQLTTDQRGAGFSRQVDGPDADAIATVDIGAYEQILTPLANLADTSTNEDTQLIVLFSAGDTSTITSVTATSSNTTLVPNDAAHISAALNGSAGVVTINPAANLFGSTNITVTVNRTGGPESKTFLLTVNSVNDAPSFTRGADPIVNEDAGAQTINNFATSLSPGPPEESGQTLTFQVISNDNVALFSAGPAISANGALTYAPAADAAGFAVVTINLKDDGGTANGGVDTSLSMVFVISVQQVNDAPSFTKGADQTANVNAGAQSVPSWATNISRGPANEANQTLTFQITSNTNPAIFLAPPAVSSTGTLSYTPSSIVGTAAITVILKDNGGTVNGGVDTSLAQTFTITVTNAGAYISFAAASSNTTESSGATTVTVNRTGDASRAVTVDYTTSAGNSLPCSNASGVATPKCDFTTAVGTLSFAVGDTSKTVTVLISQDSFVEGPETFTLTLANLTGGATFDGPATTAITIADDVTEPPANPIDDTRNFVRQHYHDFLNREPDPSGWDFWTNQISSCGSDAQCNEVRRIDVSASFFLSIEFQQSGYLVERFYKTGYGDATGTSTFVSNHQLRVPIVRFSEFLKDTQRIGQGVTVLAPGWEQALENNKQAYALEFVQTSRFTTALPTTLMPDQFVFRLDLNAGFVLNSSEFTAAINLFGGASDTSNVTARAQAMRMVADDTNLYNAEFNRAFVLAEYFGYLRRNPNDAPETTLDYTGYDFWLTKLNQFNGNYINAEMVKAFLSSIEYRQRFGP